MADMTVDRFVPRRHAVKKVVGEIVLLIFRHALNDGWLHNVDAGIDRIANDFRPTRLLNKAENTAIFRRFHHTKIAGIVDVGQRNRHQCLFRVVGGDDRLEVKVGQGITRQDQERFVIQKGQRQPHTARRAEWHFLDGVLDIHAEAGAIAVVILDAIGQILEGDHDIEDAVPFQQHQHMF